MKLCKEIVSFLVGASIVVGCLTGAEAKTKIIGGDKLYADLNHDGHVERVSLVQYEVPFRGRHSNTMELARLVVFDDKGNVLWRGPQISNESDIDYKNCDNRVIVLATDFGGYECTAFLHDLDGDGCTELCIEDATANAPGYYYILRWKNGKFVDTGKNGFTYIGNDQFALGSPDKQGGDVLYNLRKVNGKLIAWFSQGCKTMDVELFVEKKGILKIKRLRAHTS